MEQHEGRPARGGESSAASIVSGHDQDTEATTMTTIRLVDDASAGGLTKEIFDAVLRRERAVFGATAVSNIWRCMGHSPALLEANWNRSRALMQRGRFTPLQRELVATAVSIANACTY